MRVVGIFGSALTLIEYTPRLIVCGEVIAVLCGIAVLYRLVFR